MTSTKFTVQKRTFEAAEYPKLRVGGERNRLNQCPLTSEYFRSFKWCLVRNSFMSDGTINTSQPIYYDEYKTKKEAMETGLNIYHLKYVENVYELVES